jgi:UDP-N-acetylmuramate--alanine ligase
MTAALEAEGIRIHIGHKASNVGDAEEVVISSAIRKDNPELVTARQQGLIISHRADVLARLFNAAVGISVAGTHGKTTTSGMVATILHHNGEGASYIIGGVSNELGDNARNGASPYLVIEADESDGTLIKYHPVVAILTNAELDHPDFYHSMEQLEEVYRTYLGHIKPGGLAIVCADDPDAMRVLQGATLSTGTRVLTYGLSDSANLRAHSVETTNRGMAYQATLNGKELGKVSLSVFGQHNVCNSLAAIAAAMETGLTFEAAALSLAKFTGMRRRFQVISSDTSVRVVDDYAHHPSEVRATLRAARHTGAGRIISVFQPHRYSRTQSLAQEFGRAFDLADEVIITDVYSAGEDPIPGVGSQLILESLKQSKHPSARLVHGLENVEAEVAGMVRPQDLVITMGAGDIWKVAHGLGKRLAAAL